MTDDVTEAMSRLAGRRADAIEVEASARVVVPGTAQNRKQRRMNFAKARTEARQMRRAVEAVQREEDRGVWWPDGAGEGRLSTVLPSANALRVLQDIA